MDYNSLKNYFEDWIKINLVDKKLGLMEIKEKFIDDAITNDEIKQNDEELNLTIAKLINDFLNEEKICKVENNGSTKFYYNPKLYSETQNNIIKKSKKNKQIIIITISIIIIGILASIIYSNIKENERIKQRNIEIANSEKEVAENIVREIAKNYNLDDIKYDHIEYGSLSSTVIYTTSKYEKLTEKEKLQFIVDVASETHLKELFPSGSQAAGSYYEIAIVSEGHRYSDFTTDGQSELIKDKKIVYKMPTDYAKDIEQSLDSMLHSSDDNSSSSKKYYSVQYNYSGCYPSKPHYVCYEKGRCRCVANP